MNKSVSLPRICKPSSPSNNQSFKSRKNSNEYLQVEGLISEKNRMTIQSIKTKPMSKNQNYSLKNFRSLPLTKKNESQELQTNKQTKFGILQNGKLSKITESSVVSKVLSTQRSKFSVLQNQDKKQAAKIKKELNQVTSSSLILKKQIKAMQGQIAQFKQQIRNFFYQNPINSNGLLEQKIQDIRKKTEVVKYEQQIFKNMKDKLKKIKIFFQKNIIQEKQVLERQQKRNEILKQRSAVRQFSINLKKNEVKKLQQTEKSNKKLIQLTAKDYQKKLKTLNELKSYNQKNKNIRTLSEDEYHYDVHKKQEAQLKSNLLSNILVQNMLGIRFNRLSLQYESVEKAQKLMQMHSLQKEYEQFDARKIYQGSFQNKKQLQKMIKYKQNKLSETINKNTQLRLKWQQFRFKEIDQQQKITENTEMSIKTGLIEQKQMIQQQHRQNISEMRKQLQMSKQRAAKLFKIQDWVMQMQRTLSIEVFTKSTTQQRLISVIQHFAKQNNASKNLDKLWPGN